MYPNPTILRILGVKDAEGPEKTDTEARTVGNLGVVGDIQKTQNKRWCIRLVQEAVPFPVFLLSGMVLFMVLFCIKAVSRLSRIASALRGKF